MKIYLLLQGRCNDVEHKANVFFLKRSAMAAAKRIQSDRDDWESVSDHGTDAVAFWITPALWVSVVPLLLLFRDWSLRRWVRNHAHWQNLNEDRNGKVKGSILRNGRAWFHPFGYGHKRRKLEMHWEWVFWSKRWHLQFDVGSGDANDGVSFDFGFGLFSFYFTVEGVLPGRVIEWGRKRALQTEWLGYKYEAWPRSTGIRFFEQTIWFEIWNWDFGWDSRQPKWMSFNWSPVDFLFGKTRYASREIVTETSQLAMPEASYPVTIKLTEDSWKRPRWPAATQIRRARIQCERGIPTPGKGENSWDCGQDATFGLTCPAATVEEALVSLKASVTRDRERYGGKSWRPKTV